ncbi:MAG: NAD(P)-dependent oxidoreductase [Enhydrobacter sp.]|nr:NAD(P)-dependent oxidoreductase [Enhydrobacter sp.]
MKRKRVLICGATGFIGRNLVEALSRRTDFEIHAVRFTRPEYAAESVIWHRADLRDARQVDALLKGMEIVIQAAATTSGARDIVATPFIHVTDNAVMNSLLLRACFNHKVERFVFLSCSVMYGPRERPWRESEWDPAQPMHPRYFGIGWTKLYIEKMCEFFGSLNVTKHTVIRHTNVFGPHDKFDLERSHVVGATVTKAMTNEGTISVWGTGEEARDLIYVDDLVSFVERAIEFQTCAYALLHASAGEAIAIRDLVARIVAASQRDLRIEYNPEGPTIKTSFALDNSRAREVLGWQPQVSFDEGIRRTIAWWRATYGQAQV